MKRTRYFILAVLLIVPIGSVFAESPTTRFDGKSLEAWEFTPGGWVIDSRGAMTCKMQKVKDKKGRVRTKGMGYIWTKHEYGDFELSLSYKLSEAANSGVFFRTDKDDPVQAGLEIQLMDNKGYQAAKGAKAPKDAKKLNGALYDSQAAEADPAKPAGEWNQLQLVARGTKVTLRINGVTVNQVDLSRWDTPGKNPDGSSNKFKTALGQLPRKGRIGFQNHGNAVWFKDIVIQPL